MIILPFTLVAAIPYSAVLWIYLNRAAPEVYFDVIPWALVITRGIVVLLGPAALLMVWLYRRPTPRTRWAYDWLSGWVVAHTMGRLGGSMRDLIDLHALDQVGRMMTTWSALVWLAYETCLMIAATIYVTMLLQEERSERQRLEGLMSFARQVSTLDYQGILDETAKELHRLLRADACVVYLWDTQTERLQPVAGVHAPHLYAGELVETIMSYGIPRGYGLIGGVMESGQPVLCADFEADPRARPVPEREVEARSAIFAPLLVEERNLGVVRLFRHGADQFNQDDLDFVMSFVSQAALLIEHGRVLNELSKISITDSLTGLHNSRYLHACLDREGARAEREGYELSLVMLDSDSLKQVNDRLGHQMGDHYLREIARVLRESIRKGDEAFRYAGDEFLVVLPMAGTDEAFEVAERIRRGVESIDLNRRFPCTVSVGVASMPAHASSPVRLLAAADEAMYLSKRGGKNRTSMYQPYAENISG